LFSGLPRELVLQIQITTGDSRSICGLEAGAASVPRASDGAWGEMLEMLYPNLFLRLSSEGFDGSYKQVLLRRMDRATEWRRRKEFQRPRVGSGSSGSSAQPSKKKKLHCGLFYADNRQGALADSTLRLKTCGLCGEKYSASSNRGAGDGCHFHPGALEPAGPEAGDLSRFDRQLVAKSARSAVRMCGGAAGRRSRTGGHGHWARGLGLPAAVGGKVVLWEAGCPVAGEISCEWSCCGGLGLFAAGCAVGPHRPRHA